ncbi:hypothetical protein P7K49_005703, partial [Saguinus oedipus]
HLHRCAEIQPDLDRALAHTGHLSLQHLSPLALRRPVPASVGEFRTLGFSPWKPQLTTLNLQSFCSVPPSLPRQAALHQTHLDP